MREILTEEEVASLREELASAFEATSPLLALCDSHEALRAHLAAKAGRCGTCACWNQEIRIQHEEGIETRVVDGCYHPNRPVAVMPTNSDFGCSLWTERTER